MKNIFYLYTIILFSSTLFAQSKTDVNVDYMLRGYIYAGTDEKDNDAFGGFGGSDNAPKKIDNTIKFNQQGFYLFIDTTSKTTFAKEYNGYTLFIINKTDTTTKLDASDSRLSVIAEAYIDNKWQAIEYLPSSWCGNSYHNVFIKPNKYWAFTIPKYSGKIKTKIRYRLTLANNLYIYSNEIIASINKKQLTEKQGHTPSGLMDPYDE